MNFRPDALMNGKMKEMLEKVTQLECVYTTKIPSRIEVAHLRLDPVVCYFDLTKSENKEKVAECLRPYAQFTRPGLPAGIKPIYRGIGFADQSMIARDSSWGDVITKSIAEVAWAGTQDQRQANYVRDPLAKSRERSQREETHRDLSPYVLSLDS